MFIRTYLHMYTYLNANDTHTSKYVCKFTCISMYVYVHTHKSICICIYVHLHTFAHINVAYTNVLTKRCTFVMLNIHSYVYMYML